MIWAVVVLHTFGSMNFVHRDDHRVDLRRLELMQQADSDALNFAGRLRGCLDLEQQVCTRRRLADSPPVLFSRIDHIHATVSPSDLSELGVLAHTVGDLLFRSWCVVSLAGAGARSCALRLWRGT